MAYQSLYRKYRPQTFGDVVGQGHVVRTLQNALASGRIAHGYLFTGTRGTAKTTVARLLAKCLNCESQGRPVAEPCNACDACRSITAGTCIDVIEMDAASHRGVADIEEVRKAVGYGPMQFRFKVFIIDEAHQLSSDAKDAFLKTLEEPPPGVVFVLATTEPQAIPITIRSRCQQFDFKRGSVADIAERLRHVLDHEGVAHTPDALQLVARAAEGSYRDSLSLLEQVLAFSPERVSAIEVETVLGALDSQSLDRLVDAIARRDAPDALALAGELIDAGKEARTLLRTVSSHFRDLLLARVGGPAASAELNPDEARRLQAQAAQFAPEQLLRAIDRVNEALGELRWNNQHRLLMELTFLKLMNLGDGPAEPLAVAPIVFGAQPAPAPTAAPVPRAVPEPQTVSAPEPPQMPPAVEDAESEVALFADDVADDPEDEFAPETLEADDAAPADTYVIPDIEPPVAAAPEPEPEPLAPPENDGMSLFGDDPAVAPSPPLPAPSLFDDPVEAAVEPQAPAVPPLDETPEEPTGALTGGSYDDDVPEDEPLPSFDAEPEPVPVEPDSDPRITLDRAHRAWPRFLADAEKVSKQAQVFLSAARPSSVEGRTVVITFASRANCEMMRQPRQEAFIRRLLARALGIEDGSVPVRLEIDDQVPPPPQRSVKRTKVRHDPMAALDALDKQEATAEAPASEPPPAPWSAPPPPDPAPASRRPAPRDDSHEPPAALAPPPEIPDRGDANGTADRRAEAMAHPLVQEILSTFGGEVVEP